MSQCHGASIVDSVVLEEELVQSQLSFAKWSREMLSSSTGQKVSLKTEISQCCIRGQSCGNMFNTSISKLTVCHWDALQDMIYIEENWQRLNRAGSVCTSPQLVPINIDVDQACVEAEVIEQRFTSLVGELALGDQELGKGDGPSQTVRNLGYTDVS